MQKEAQYSALLKVLKALQRSSTKFGWQYPLARLVVPRPVLASGSGYALKGGGHVTLPTSMAIPRWEWLKDTGAGGRRQ